MSELNLAPIRDLVFAYGVRDMTPDEQGQVIEAVFTLCDCIEHVLAYAAEVERLAREEIEEVRSGA